MGIDTGVTSMSDVDIANAALIKLGQSMIGAFSDDSDPARSAAALYIHDRDLLLRKIPWNFARKWTLLSALSAVPLSLDIISPSDVGTGQVTYTGAYALPGDFLRLYRFSPKDATFRIVGQAIYTDATPVNVPANQLLGLEPPNANGSNIPVGGPGSSGTIPGMEYIARITNPVLFDPMFTEVLINKLILDMGFNVAGLDKVIEDAKEAYEEALVEAATVNGMENWADPLYDTSIVDVRMGYSSTGWDFNG